MPPKTKTLSGTKLSDLTTDELRKLIRDEMKSTSQELLRDFIRSDEFRDIIHQETRDAIKNEFGNRLDELDSAVKSLSETQGTVSGMESSMDFLATSAARRPAANGPPCRRRAHQAGSHPAGSTDTWHWYTPA